MKDEGNHQGAVDKSFSEQRIRIVDANYIFVRKIGPVVTVHIVVSRSQTLFLNVRRRRAKKGSGPPTIFEWCSSFSKTGWLLVSDKLLKRTGSFF